MTIKKREEKERKMLHPKQCESLTLIDAINTTKGVIPYLMSRLDSNFSRQRQLFRAKCPNPTTQEPPQKDLKENLKKDVVAAAFLMSGSRCQGTCLGAPALQKETEKRKRCIRLWRCWDIKLIDSASALDTVCFCLRREMVFRRSLCLGK